MERSRFMVGVLAQKWIKAEKAKREKESKKDANEKLLDEMEKDLKAIRDCSKVKRNPQ